MSRLRQCAKAAVALVGAVGTWGIVAGEDSLYTHVEWYGLVLALATAAGVYLTPNGDDPADPGVR